MKKKIVILGLLLCTILAGCGGKQSVVAPPLQEPIGVQPDRAAAYIGDIYDVTYFNSAVVPYVEELSFEIDGVIAEVYFHPGMVVEKGDVLVQLDMSAEKARLQQLNSELAHAEKVDAFTDADAQLDIELLEVERKQLQQQGASALEIKLKENEIAQKRAALRQTQQLRELDKQAKESELEALNQALSKDTLRAPFSGQILYSDMLSTGMQVNAYDSIVFLADNTQLQLRGEYIKPTVLKSADLVIAHVGDAQYEIVERPADEEELTSAALSNSTVETIFDFADPEMAAGKVEAGQYAAIFVYSDYVRDALLLPREAVLTDAAGSYVYVDENGQRVRREVKLGKTTDGLAQITDGLQEGEVVYVK